MLVSELRKLLKNADSLSLFATAAPNRESWSDEATVLIRVKHETRRKDGTRSETYSEATVGGAMAGYRLQPDARAHAWLYGDLQTLVDLLAVLPGTYSVRFRFEREAQDMPDTWFTERGATCSAVRLIIADKECRTALSLPIHHEVRTT